MYAESLPCVVYQLNDRRKVVFLEKSMGKGERRERYRDYGCWQEFLDLRQMWLDAGIARPEHDRRAEREIEFKYFDGPEPPIYRERDLDEAVTQLPAQEPDRIDEISIEEIPQAEMVRWVQMNFLMARALKKKGGNLINQIIDNVPDIPNQAALGMLVLTAEDKDFIFEVYKMGAKMITGSGESERMYDDGSDASEETLQRLAGEASPGLGRELSLATPAEIPG